MYTYEKSEGEEEMKKGLFFSQASLAALQLSIAPNKEVKISTHGGTYMVRGRGCRVAHWTGAS